MLAALEQDSTGKLPASRELAGFPDEIDPGPKAGVKAPLPLTGMCHQVLSELLGVSRRQAPKQLRALRIECR